MEKLVALIRKTLGDFDAMQLWLSQEWRPHSNRRTIAILAIAGIAATGAYLFAIRPPDDFPVRELVTVPDGASLRQVAESLAEQHVVRSPLAFEASLYLLGRARSAKSGDYIFTQPVSVWSVARRIATGAFGLEPVRIRIPEGATTREMSDMLSRALPRFNGDKFLLVARPQEGYLFPDTYFFLPNAREDAVLQALRQNFDEKTSGLSQEIASSSRSLKDIVTMASIIEREARNPADRRMISGVLWNRIRKGMPLQVDVTFLYTIGKNTFQLTTADLKADNPYNTYVNKGLPPGPIGSPSLDSIQAAIRPTPSKYLFYLADHSGVTHYSETYQQHLEYKRLYLGT
jgi:UPF0755 protein